MPAKVQVIFYSMYGHVYQMADAVAAGAREGGGEVSLWQVPELVPGEVLEKSGAAVARAAFAHVPVANPSQLAEPMRSFLAPQRALATWPRRCEISSIKPADCG
jgi:NAD(P)H dehydrogenase (quinone)